MRTEITARPKASLATVEITVILSEKNLRELTEDHRGLVNGVVKVNGRLLTPFAEGRLHIMVEPDEIHYADVEREEAKQKIREARRG